MKRMIVTLAIVSLFVMSFAGIAQAAGPLPNAGQLCKDGLAKQIETTLEAFLLVHIGQQVDLTISQGSCVSVVRTHLSANGVNTTAMATDICKSLVPPQYRGESLRACVEHVGPGLVAVFHPQ